MSDERSTWVIRASELGQYAFCARSWWLEHVRGYPSDHVQEMEHGQFAHQVHGRIVVRYHRLQRLAYALLWIAALIGAVGLALLVRGV
jgi:hypothetical protein